MRFSTPRIGMLSGCGRNASQALLAPAAAYTRLRVALRDVSAGALAVAEAVLMRQAWSQDDAWGGAFA